MAPYPKQPLVDLQNPCYCPSLPARAYIHSLHQSVCPAGGFTPLGVVNHFTKALAQSVHTPGLVHGDKGVLDSDSESSSSSLSSSSDSSATTITHSSSTSSDDSGNEEFHSVLSDPQALSFNATTTLAGPAPPGLSMGVLDTTATTDNISFDLNHLKRFTSLRDSHLLARPPRKRKSSSASDSSGKSGGSNSGSDKSDIRGPPKRARSMLGTLERSFKVRLKRKILNYDVPSSTRAVDPPLQAPESYHFASPRLPLVDSSTPPGLGKKKSDLEKFIEEILDWQPDAYIDPRWTVQEIVNYLADCGLIRGSLMKIMGRFSDLHDLSLTTSLKSIYGHHPSGIKDVISELHTPGAFKGLVSLSIEYVPLNDDDVLCFHHLPGLQYLSLRETCITNTAVYLLSPHRHTLIQLDICYNWDINNDAIAPLLNFKKLTRLNMVGTHITMEGLRRYARVAHEDNRIVQIYIPEACEQKLHYLSSDYLTSIPPLLVFVTDPEDSWNLTLSELRMNLYAHQEMDERIVVTGNKSELRERLRKLLERRKEDLLIRKMVEYGRRSDENGDDE